MVVDDEEIIEVVMEDGPDEKAGDMLTALFEGAEGGDGVCDDVAGIVVEVLVQLTVPLELEVDRQLYEEA